MRYFFLSIILCAAHYLGAQSCCGELVDKVFTSFTRRDSIYATAQPNYQGTNINLVARITDAPLNTCEKRPLLLLMHGGGYAGGNASLMDSVATEFAARGYLCASISYRLGFYNTSNYLCPTDTTELIRAWYRSVQDYKSAVRWFKANSASLRIDTNLIFAGGWSAGGYATTGLAWMNREEEKPLEAGALNDIIQNSIPQSRPDLGSVQGISNLNGHSSNVKGIISFSSSFLFSQHLDEEDEESVLFFNNKQDMYAIPWENCSQDVWDYLCPIGLPQSCGIESMTTALEDLNILYDYRLYETTACSHNLHDPCFPFFQDEMLMMADFLNDQSTCGIITSSQTIAHPPKQTTPVCIVLQENIRSLVFPANTAFMIGISGQKVRYTPAKISMLPAGLWQCTDLNGIPLPLRFVVM